MEDSDDMWTIRFEDIVLGEKLGEGQFGSVYKGDLEGTPVAVKKQLRDLNADVMVYIQREMETVKRLAHPHIVQFLGLAKHENAAWVVTEYCARGDLAGVLHRSTEPIAWSQRVHYALDAVQAIAFLHSKGIMHRDIKAENMLLDEYNKLKLCDFGFALKVDTKLANLLDKKKMKAMTIAGTDDYMAPEVILGMPYAYPADIFSFGITLAELILRQKPFPRHPRAAFEFEVAEFTAAVPPDCPPEFSALVIACCAYEPTQRPDAKTILRGLRELLTVVQKREAAAAAPAEPRAPSPRPTPVPVTPLASSTEHEQPVSSALPRTRAASLPTVAAAVVAAPVVASGPYQGRSPSPLDMAPSGLPREKSFTRSLCAFCATPMDSKPLPDVRRRWVPLSAVPASAPQATLELEYGTKKRSHIKALFVLWGDVLFYWPKGSKRIDYNIGRILVDRSLRVQLLEVGKKKTQLRLVGWNGEEFSLLAKPPVLQQWHDAIVKAQAASLLDLVHVYDATATDARGRTPLLQGDVLAWPVQLKQNESGDSQRGSTRAAPPDDAAAYAMLVQQQVMMCVSAWGVRLCAPFLEEVLVEFPYSAAVKWSIQRNDVCELVVASSAAASGKTLKTMALEFSCDHSERVYAALEACSKGQPATFDVILSPRVNV